MYKIHWKSENFQKKFFFRYLVMQVSKNWFFIKKRHFLSFSSILVFSLVTDYVFAYFKAEVWDIMLQKQATKVVQTRRAEIAKKIIQPCSFVMVSLVVVSRCAASQGFFVASVIPCFSVESCILYILIYIIPVHYIRVYYREGEKESNVENSIPKRIAQRATNV